MWGGLSGAVFVFGLMRVLGFWEVESEARSLCPV